MATLSKVDAARQLGIARSILYKLIDQGKLSPTADSMIDQAEFVRVAAHADMLKGHSRTSADTSMTPILQQAETPQGRPRTASARHSRTSADVLVDILREQIQTPAC
jgi:hypothetical protein